MWAWPRWPVQLFIHLFFIIIYFLWKWISISVNYPFRCGKIIWVYNLFKGITGLLLATDDVWIYLTIHVWIPFEVNERYASLPLTEILQDSNQPSHWLCGTKACIWFRNILSVSSSFPVFYPWFSIMFLQLSCSKPFSSIMDNPIHLTKLSNQLWLQPWATNRFFSFQSVNIHNNLQM